MVEQISSQELWSRVDALAERLGVAAGQLFEITKARVITEAWCDLAILATLALVLVTVALVCLRKSEWDRGPDNGWAVVLVIDASLSIAFFAPLLLCVRDAVLAISYPDYAAFQRIVELIK